MATTTTFRKNKFKAAPFLINAIIFFLGGVDEIERGRFYFSLILIAVSLLNLIIIKTNDRNLGNFLIMAISSVLALFLAFEWYLGEANYKHYLWLGSFLLSAVVALLSLYNYRKAKSEAQKAKLSQELTRE